MTPLDEIELEMKRLRELSELDTEKAHDLADDCLIKLIRILKTISTDVQIERILSDYMDMDKWYS